jgi:hypothetical protein
VRLLWFSDRVWRCVGFAVAALLRFVALGRADLWTDEIQTLHAVRLDWAAMTSERLAAGHAPLYFFVEKAWTSVAGESQFALRAPAAVFGLLALVPAWSLFRRLAGESAAWWGTSLLALHPVFVELSREARMYSLLALVLLAFADGAAAALDGARPGAMFWAAALLGPLVHPTWGLALPPLAAWLAFERRSVADDAKRSSLAALLGIAGSLVLLCVLLAFATPQHQELTRRPWPRESGVFVLRIFAGSDLTPFHGFLAAAGVFGNWLIFAGYGWMHATPRVRRFALAWGVGVPATSVLVGLVGGVPWGPVRYVQAAAVGFSLLFAVAGSTLARARGRESRAPILLLVALLCSLFPFAAPATAWSDAAAKLADDPSPVVVPDESSRIVLAHYLGRDVYVGAAPPGAERVRRAALVVEAGRREVRITDEAR